MKCPNCGFESPREMRFCGACGAALTVACSACGFANPLDFRFCGMCGMRLAADAAPVSIEPPSAPAEAEAAEAVLQPPEAERRVVTVVLTDLTDSTHLLEEIGTEDWVEVMHRILHVLETEVYRFGGEVSQFRGDGLVAFFGATSAHEDDPERAVLAALSMQRAFEQYVREQARPEVRDLKMRVGVSTGEAIVTIESEREQWAETAMGAAVSLAARMEAAAEPGTVLVSEHTYRLVSAQFVWESIGAITVKGVSQPTAVYRPTAHIVHAEQLPPELVLWEPIMRIGREDEFRALKAGVEGLFEGRGRILVLTGDQGSGKAFLLNEVRQYFAHRGPLLAESHPEAPAASPTLTWMYGRCRSYTQTWPYSMWLNLFHDRLGTRPDESREGKIARLRRHTETAWGDRFDEHYPYLATLLGLPLEETFAEKIRHLDGEGLRQRIFLAVRSELEESSHKGPLVISFSDLQWADESSLALLKYCLPLVDRETLVWVLTYRLDRESPIPDFQHDLEAQYPHRLTQVDLEPLTESQSLEFIAQLIGPETLPRETRELIMRNASGNPFYILELLRSLIAKGILARDSAEQPWRLTRTVTTLDLPDSLQRLLLARVDRLSTHERLILQVAAVIGPVFWSDMLEGLLGETPHLHADLVTLQRGVFIQERGRVPELGMEYHFTSPLLRDTAYESLLTPQRAAYHLKAAQYLENTSNPDVLDDFDGMLAYHYRGAGNPRKELFYAILAAGKAHSMYAHTEALQHYNRALELLDELEATADSQEQHRAIQSQRFEVLNGRREVYSQLGQLEQARADTQALLPLAREMSDDQAWLIDALLAQAEISTNERESLAQGLRMAEEALALSRQLGDQPRELRSLIRVSNLRFIHKDPSWLGLAEHALNLARQLGDLKTEVNLLLGIGHSYGMDDLPRSRDYLEAALSRSKSLNDKATELELLQALGQQFERDGDYHRQLIEFEEKRVRLSREIGNRVAEGNALMFCGQIQALYLGDYENGLELEQQALRIWENMTSKLFPLLRIAQIQIALGQHPEAEATLATARPLGSQTIFEVGRAGLGLVTAILYNAMGGIENLQNALDLTVEIQQMVTDNLVSRQYQIAAACEASASHLALARAFNDEAAWEEHQARALEFSQRSVDQYQGFGFVQIVECTSEEIFFRHSQALAANGRDADAKEFLERAHAEMMRKHDLIPAGSHYRKTFLKNIQLHRDIRAAFRTLTRAKSMESLRWLAQ